METQLAYHLDTRPENLMALAAYALGLGLLATLQLWTVVSRWFATVTERIGPEHLYRASLAFLGRFSDRIHGYEVHDLRGRIAWVLAPVGVLVLLGLIFTSNENAFLAGEIAPSEYVMVLVLAVACGAALTATRVRAHLPAILLLSAVGIPAGDRLCVHWLARRRVCRGADGNDDYLALPRISLGDARSTPDRRIRNRAAWLHSLA